MTNAKKLAASIIDKHKRVAELRTWLTVNDMAGLECAQTVEAEELQLEIAAEGVELARHVQAM